ncbi:MAG: hypothetical protein ABSD21_06045 [Rhizomicrobium sp.]|jgi:hypothetical protein
MTADYRPRADTTQTPKKRQALSHDLLHGMSPKEFDDEAKALADADAMTPAVRARMKAQLIERLKTPVDQPSWGPDWVRQGERAAAQSRKGKGVVGKILSFSSKKKDKDEASKDPPLTEEEVDDAAIISRNMEKSRQVSHYKPLYAVAVVVALAILLVAMFVDYHIIREVWTRALSNEFMVVPPSLQSSVVFKSLQVIFAVLIVHFMLKITGAYGRNTMIVAAFVMAVVMIGGLGYLVAYNNMAGGTSTTMEQHQAPAQSTNSIDALFVSNGGVQSASLTRPAPQVASASTAEGVSLGLPKLSQTSLADADSWFWLAFASVIFFIVTTVAALYMQIVENNVRNFHIADDYKHRRKQFAQLHLLELAEQKGA